MEETRRSSKRLDVDRASSKTRSLAEGVLDVNEKIGPMGRWEGGYYVKEESKKSSGKYRPEKPKGNV